MTNTTLMSATVIAIAWLLFGNFAGVIADVIVKQFADYSGIYQYLFIRQIMLVTLIFPLFIRQKVEKRRFESPGLQFVRGNLIVIGGACVVVTLTSLPLATAHVVFYTTPVLTLILAVAMFHEPLQKHRIINCILCFLGVIIALNPGDLGWGVVAGVTASLCVAFYNLTTRKIAGQLSSISILFWSTLCSIPALGLLSAWDWRPFTWELLWLTGGSAIAIGGYQLCCAFSYRRAEASAVSIAEYSSLVFAVVIGWAVFAENLELRTLAGIALIMAPIIWQSHKEGRKEASQDLTSKEPISKEQRSKPITKNV